MAAEKKSSVTDALAKFKEVMTKSNFTDFEYVNGMMFSENAKEVKVVIVPDRELWLAILDDPELKEHVKELDITKSRDCHINNKISYASDIVNGWVDLDSTKLYNGEALRISIDGFKYQIPISKVLFPMYMKKSDFNHLTYKVFMNPFVALALKKTYESKVQGGSFSVMRVFQVI